MNDYRTKLPHFSGHREDFLPWRRRFENAMEIVGIGDILARDHKVPDSEASDADRHSYLIDNRKLFSYLRECLDEQNIIEIDEHCYRDGLKAWKLLIKHYEAVN